jgi:phosphate transport system substrate-binding protein
MTLDQQRFAKSLPPAKKRSRKTFARWVLPLLLLLGATQLLLLGLAWVFFRNQPMSSPIGGIGLPLGNSQAISSNCIAPTSVQQDRTAYTQICSAMREVFGVPEGQFFYGGTMAAAAMRSPKVVSNISQAHPEFRLRYLDPLNIAPDSTTGIKMVLNGDLSFAESQRSLRDSEYNIAESRGFKLKQIPVAITGVVFYVNPQLRIKGLSYLQLQAIYTGQVSNWQELGGPSLPIVPVSQDQTVKGSNIGLLMDGLDPEDQKLSSTVVKVRDNTTAIRRVAATPGAIGYGIQAITVGQKSVRLIGVGRGSSKNYIEPFTPDGKINKDVIRNGSYPLIQRIFVIVRADGTLDEVAGTAYANLLLSKEGQQIVDAAGYASIR